MQQAITILICDDHKLIRETWAFILNKDGRFTVVAITSAGNEALEQAKSLKPEIILMDINLPDMTGVEATKLIRKYVPGTKIIALSSYTQPTYARRMMLAGAMGYITKTSGKMELLHAISEVHEGRKYICTEIKNNLADEEMPTEAQRPDISSLSPREIEIIKLVSKGSSSKQIAEVLKLSPKTVEVHRYNIMKKLKLKNAAALINYMNLHQAELM